ncbi:MAG: RNA-binding protein [Nocardioides sp.]|nr:RNA-binding protein [Nocardioides sp.]
MAAEPVDVPISDESIKLGQFLKLANLVESGAEAKHVLAGGVVKVNGEPESRRGRQLTVGDVVSVAAAAARVVDSEGEINVPW